MNAKPWKALLPVALLGLAALWLAGGALSVHAGAAPALATLWGRGILGKLMCVGCAASLVFVAGAGSPLALLITAVTYPDATLGCLALCYIASQG